MSPRPARAVAALRRRHDRAWRDPTAVVSHWREAGEVDPRLLEFRVRGAWWETLAAAGVTLLVTREYEHLILALHAGRSGPVVTYLRLPHPSGLAWDGRRHVVHVASTRNPNLVWDLRPATALGPPAARAAGKLRARPLVPVRARYYPGCLYLHDLALVGRELHANAVGQNAIVRLREDGRYAHVWWPRAIERRRRPDFSRNYLQLNSIAAGSDLRRSFFSASTDTPGARRPGQSDFPVDGRGVIFSGRTREPVVRGLTRPHSARLHRGRLWVANSGYGEVGLAEGGQFHPVARLPGWTRGLAFHGRVAFAGTSRVLPRFRQYAPGLDVARSDCGLHALDTRTGRLLGSIVWPYGNQIFTAVGVPTRLTTGLPFPTWRRRTVASATRLFYAFETDLAEEARSP